MKKNKKEYLNLQGVCPCCKQYDLDYRNIQFDGENAYFPYRCKNCGTEGEEWYYLDFTGHQVYDYKGILEKDLRGIICKKNK